ncbi:hypothetical protein BC826DRAFT_71163 [Russula brevipes]|nr:hypothetical protein BC826DRAFT_71163 [Russula brevipes]
MSCLSMYPLLRSNLPVPRRSPFYSRHSFPGLSIAYELAAPDPGYIWIDTSLCLWVRSHVASADFIQGFCPELALRVLALHRKKKFWRFVLNFIHHLGHGLAPPSPAWFRSEFYMDQQVIVEQGRDSAVCDAISKKSQLCWIGSSWTPRLF